MDYSKNTEKQNDPELDETESSALQFGEEMINGSLKERSVDVPVESTDSMSPESTPQHFSQSSPRSCIFSEKGRAVGSMSESQNVSAPISIPSSSRVITGFSGPTSSPGQSVSQHSSLQSSHNKSIESSTEPSKHGEISTSQLSHTGGAVSPSKGTFGSLLSQRLSGMVQMQKNAPKVVDEPNNPKGDSVSSERSELSQQKLVASQKLVNCASTPASVKSFASSLSQGSASGCSTSTLNQSTAQPKRNKPKCKVPLKVDLPKRLHTFSESTTCEQSPASLRSLFGSITVWKSGSILSRHLSHGSSTRIVNYVTEAQSVLPSLTSAFSINHLEEKELSRQVELAMYDLQDNQHAVSHQEKLDILDILENNEYVDTVKSTDSAASLLRRSMSVPPQYHYKPQKLVLQDIFSQSQAEQDDLTASSGKSAKKLSSAAGIENENHWRQTMDDLLEQPEYQDTLESICSRTGLLASQAQAMAQQYGSKIAREPITESPSAPRSAEPTVPVKQLRFIYFKNLIVLSISFMFVFMAYMSLRNLQSSLYKKGGLGLLALSFIYASLFVGCIFTTTIVQYLRPKRTIVICMFSLLIYVGANFYPSYYTMLPACAITGFCLSNMWTAHATYLANVAARYAILVDDKVQNVLSHFNGIFFAFFQMSQIVGGLISSLVLNPRSATPETSNTTNLTEQFTFTVENASTVYIPQCGSRYCSYLADSSDAKSTVDRNMFYILISTYAGCVIIGLIIIMLCLDPLDGVMKKSHTSLSKQLTAVFRFFLQWKVGCLLGLMFYTMLQSSFMFGEFTKAFVTCTSGVYLVGYTMVCLSGMSALSSFISGRLQRYVGRKVLYRIAFAIHVSLLITELLWRPGREHIFLIFVIAGCWGLADGMMLTQTISLFGVLFADNKEPAFAGLKMTQAFGVTVMFAVSEYICTYVKLIVLLVFAALALLGLTILEIKLKKENQNKQTGPTAV